MKAIIEVSLRDASKANDAMFDCRLISSRLDQTSSNTWETEEYDEEDEETLEQLVSEIEDIFQMAGVEEYEIEKVNE